ncbi:MAG TPA: tRNA lysidine(34) synthetase TilS [Phenylobacterium sp.]|nr:tRNA lysidine(34) synthetase TilS [Phenylobacterium sp.]
MRGLEARAREVLDRRLLKDSAAPIAIALSGGGDSLALTLIADAWARAAGRPLLILTVDHGLQAQSAAWTATCAAVAARLGRPFQPLRWVGEKPVTGLPAAARRARHAELAEAARAAGARVVLMGHTADDLAEAAAMRRAGSTTPDPREWAPSPVWPEGRGVFVLRPLLRLGRGELRAWLQARGEAWIEDPANADPRYARGRARLAGVTLAPRLEDAAPLELAQDAVERAGMLSLDRTALRRADPAEMLRLAALACVCAGGGERPPAGTRVARLAKRLRADAPWVGSLAGARIEADDGQVRFIREAGEAARGGLRPTALGADGAVVWDGRFELTAPGPGRELRALAGLAGRLPRDQQAALKTLPPAARRGLPAIVGSDGGVDCPALTGAATSLVLARLRAAAGLVRSEPA